MHFIYVCSFTIISFILADNKVNAAFQFLSGEAFFISSSIYSVCIFYVCVYTVCVINLNKFINK